MEFPARRADGFGPQGRRHRAGAATRLLRLPHLPSSLKGILSLNRQAVKGKMHRSEDSHNGLSIRHLYGLLWA